MPSRRTGRAIRDCQVKFYHPVKEDYSWLSLYSVPRVDPHSGKAMGEFTIFSDATDVKRAHLALQDANEKLELKVAERTRDLKTATRLMEEQKEVLQTIIDHIPVMLVFYDAAGRVRLVNREFERAIGWSLDEIRGMDLLEPAARTPPTWGMCGVHAGSGARLEGLRDHRAIWWNRPQLVGQTSASRTGRRSASA